MEKKKQPLNALNRDSTVFIITKNMFFRLSVTRLVSMQMLTGNRGLTVSTFRRWFIATTDVDRIINYNVSAINVRPVEISTHPPSR